MSDEVLGQQQGSLYNEFPPITIGGPTGDYKVQADVTSARWVEYRVVSVAFSGNGSVVVSGRTAPKGLDYSGGTTYNTDTKVYGEAYASGGSDTKMGDGFWRRVSSSTKEVYVRIDASVVAFVSVQFRARILERIPGPATTVHPDHAHQMNIERSRLIEDHLKAVGVPGYAHKGSEERD